MPSPAPRSWPSGGTRLPSPRRVFEDLDTEGARSIVRNWLADEPAGGWLDAATASRLLASYGVRVVTTRHAKTADEAAAAADELGYPVVLKAGAPGLVHKTDVGGVRLGLDSGDAVREAFDAMQATLGDRMGDVLVQPMAAPGIELIVGVTHDPLFGPLVLLGMGGIAAELTRDTALRIVPLSVFDAHQMVRSLRSSPLLFGYRNTAQVDVAAIEDGPPAHRSTGRSDPRGRRAGLQPTRRLCDRRSRPRRQGAARATGRSVRIRRRSLNDRVTTRAADRPPGPERSRAAPRAS